MIKLDLIEQWSREKYHGSLVTTSFNSFSLQCRSAAKVAKQILENKSKKTVHHIVCWMLEKFAVAASSTSWKLSQCVDVETGMLFCVMFVCVTILKLIHAHTLTNFPSSYAVRAVYIYVGCGLVQGGRWLCVCCAEHAYKNFWIFLPGKCVLASIIHFDTQLESTHWLCVSAQNVCAKATCKTGCASVGQRERANTVGFWCVYVFSFSCKRNSTTLESMSKFHLVILKSIHTNL